MADLPENPNNREEEYLADLAGQNGTKPANPWSRKEAYLDAIDGRMDGIDAKIAALATDISLKGGVADYAHLPADAEIGDAYITEDTGILYVWVGDEWTPLNMQGGSGIESFVFYLKETDVHSGTATEIALYKDAACTQKYTVGEVTSAYTSGKQIIVRINYGPYIRELKCASVSSPVEITDANLDQQGFHLGFFFGGYSGGSGYSVYIGTYWGLADTDVWDYSTE